MFELKQNELLKTNRCKYTDEHDNSALIIREPKKIVAKLRFADGNIKAAPLVIQFPLDGRGGDNLNLSYPAGYDLQKEDVKAALSNFASLVSYWINLQQDLALLEAGAWLFKSTSPDATDEDVAKYKLERLTKYDELKDIVMAV